MEDVQSIQPRLSGVQEEFVHDVLRASAGMSEYRFLCYGGAAGGGKTFAVLTALIALCVIYPRSRWAIFRATHTSLVGTTLVSIARILSGNPNWKFNGTPGNTSWEFLPNGSRILFMSENYDADGGALNHILGLELSGAVLEQAEELSEKLFLVLQTRVGRWKTRKMPKPIILFTLNPAQNWVKELFYMPFRGGTLAPPYYFKQAFIDDNTHLDPEYVKQMKGISDERERRRLVEGDWTNFVDANALWAYSFRREKHVAKQDMEPNENYALWLSFDFNCNPMTCAVVQYYEATVRVVEQIKLDNSDIYKMCDYIKVKYPRSKFRRLKVCGDASGSNRIGATRDNMNYYRIIQKQLLLTDDALSLARANPLLEDNQVLVNAVLENVPVQISPEKAKALIWDLENVCTTPDGKIDKSMSREKGHGQSDALDCFRYFLNINLRGAVNL